MSLIALLIAFMQLNSQSSFVIARGIVAVQLWMQLMSRIARVIAHVVGNAALDEADFEQAIKIARQIALWEFG